MDLDYTRLVRSSCTILDLTVRHDSARGDSGIVASLCSAATLVNQARRATPWA
jgi:hypothetical protein